MLLLIYLLKGFVLQGCYRYRTSITTFWICFLPRAWCIPSTIRRDMLGNFSSSISISSQKYVKSLSRLWSNMLHWLPLCQEGEWETLGSCFRIKKSNLLPIAWVSKPLAWLRPTGGVYCSPKSKCVWGQKNERQWGNNLKNMKIA